MWRLVVSMQDKGRNDYQMLHLSTALGKMFNKAVELSRKELDPVMYTFGVMDPELYNDYCAARVIKDIGLTRLTAGRRRPSSNITRGNAHRCSEK